MLMYMTDHLSQMVGDTTIPHFYIRSDESCDPLNLQELNQRIRDKIQQELIPWIHNEHSAGRLFDPTLWKPFSDAHTYVDMYMGYRPLFRYAHYMFQLAIENGCSPHIDCEDCDAMETEHNVIHFDVQFVGWIRDDHERTHLVHPFHTIPPLLPGDWMSDTTWKRVESP